MESSEPKRRFPPPWRVERSSKDAFRIKDANGITVAWVYPGLSKLKCVEAVDEAFDGLSDDCPACD